MNRIKKLTAVILSLLTISSVCVFGSLSAGASSTGAGLAEWALNAYYDGWSYSWGGASPGAVDCSGLIYSYCGGNRTSMLSDAQSNGRDWGYVSNGIPRVHGLGLARPGHVGVYIENGMEVDARGDEYGVCYQEIGGWNNWTYWFKLTAVTYPTNGWEQFNGNYYYYENGQYIVNTSRTINGTTYYFDSKGRSGATPSDTSAVVSSSSSSNKSSSSAPSIWKKGSNGDEVSKIQKRLAELGFYTGAIDGDFGSKTEQAFKAFQSAAGLTPDGIAGSDRDILYSDNAPYAKTEQAKEEDKNEEPTDAAEEATEAQQDDESILVGDFSESVIEVQSRLSTLGFFGLDATGYFGEFTTEAIKSFQLANGLEATGEIDEETYALLFSDDAVAYTEPEDAEETAEEEVTEEESQESTEAEEAQNDAAVSAQAGPVQLANSASTAPTVAATSGDYVETASNVVNKTTKVAQNVLANSSLNVQSAVAAQVKRTANVWIWFVLVAIILGVVSFMILKHDSKKMTRYQKYTAKKKNSVKAQLNTKW